ncbi:hypothetical protein LXL04_030865 [Taraxacum kok-saghyz]
MESTYRIAARTEKRLTRDRTTRFSLGSNFRRPLRLHSDAISSPLRPPLRRSVDLQSDAISAATPALRRIGDLSLSLSISLSLLSSGDRFLQPAVLFLLPHLDETCNLLLFYPLPESTSAIVSSVVQAKRRAKGSIG